MSRIIARVLTVENRVSIGIPDEGEGGVCLERLSQRLCALGTDIVDGETANESRIKVSAGANALCVGKRRGSVLQRREALILLEALGECFCTLISNAVVEETAN